ncbi:polyheme membrane-associated cytochrome C [Phaeovulum sp.]|uniref:polyheme membrane-associated cytochrome C n=1 Tax=Phaeovulum sp. TaxID=2934796 RepID=UPI0039E3B602
MRWPTGTSVLFIVLCGFVAGGQPTTAQERKKPDLAKITEAWLASPHADRSAEAFNHWNDEEARVVPGECATCHTSRGIIDYLGTDLRAVNVIDQPQPLGSTVDCVTCHNPKSMALQSVVFPSGAHVDGLGKEAICSTCHQGRASGADVTAAVAGREDDVVASDLSFINIHYRAAAATQMGSVAAGGYQYDGKAYAGKFIHVKDEPSTCLSCHSQHSLKPKPVDSCASCHKGAAKYSDIRSTALDVTGTGDTGQGIAHSVATLHGMLGVAIQKYAAEVAGMPVVYDPHAFPYFFIDTDGDGLVTPGEAIFPNRYQNWTPRLLKAAYNYQFIAKDPGAYTHNPQYAIQLLQDSIADLGTAVALDMTGMARP